MYTFDTTTANAKKQELAYDNNSWDDSLAHVSRISWGKNSNWFVMEWINRDTTKEGFHLTNQKEVYFNQ